LHSLSSDRNRRYRLSPTVESWHYIQKGRAMKILCTNGVRSVMLDLEPALQRRSATCVVLTWGSTVGLAKEILRGNEGDLAVLTADAIDDLIARGKSVAGSRVDLARSGIGVAVRAGAKKPDIGSPQALRDALLAAKSVAHSKTGQSGIYFPTVLERLGIAEQMKSKLVVPESGIPIGDLVAKGQAEIGIQQISELLPVAGIDIVGPLPEPLQKVTTFSAGVLASAGNPPAARELLDFIATASRPLLQAKGLEPP
jgi:molybdate transport system substrate-binding protein